MSAIINSLTDSEQAMIRETELANMTALDEDDLLELHGRIRRARNKYVGQYRRQASARVSSVGGRGLARPKNMRNFERAEAFEDALARVSRRLSVLARQSAKEIKADRIAAARSERNAGPSTRAAASARNVGPRQAGAAKPPAKSPAKSNASLRKRQASTLAKGARRQARRDTK